MKDGPASVVVVGSLHHDIFVEAPHRPAAGETVTGRRWYPKFGGKGGNQAVAIAEAGCRVRLVSAVGDDAFGRFLLARLDEGGVEATRVARIGGVGTGMSVAIADESGDYGAVIVSGANLRIDPAALAGPDLWDGAAFLVLQNEIAEAVNLAAARIARSRGVRVCLNAAPWRATGAELLGLVDILVVNALEAETLCETPVDGLATARAAALRLAERFPLAVVTAGGDGVAMAGEGTDLAMPAERVPVLSTHGAGDRFVGTFVARLAAGDTRDEALHRANKAASAHVSRGNPSDRSATSSEV